MDYTNVFLNKHNQKIIKTNIENYISEKIKTDKQYKSYFDLKRDVEKIFDGYINKLLCKTNLDVLKLFNIELMKPGQCVNDTTNDYNIKLINYKNDKDYWKYDIKQTTFVTNISPLHSKQISMKSKSNIILTVETTYDHTTPINLIKIIYTHYLTKSEVELIQLFINMHYDVFCELNLLVKEYCSVMFKFKKANTMLKKYPDYSKFLTGCFENELRVKKSSKYVVETNLIKQFEEV